MYDIDVIFLSDGKSDALRDMTAKAVATLLASEPATAVCFHVYVIESCSALCPFQYPGTETIYPKRRFGYNAFMNMGIAKGTSPFVCMCNNDLVFHPNWASNIIAAMEADATLLSASPICHDHHPARGFLPDTGNFPGYTVAHQLCGWCIFVRRQLFSQVGMLDEQYRFWYCDSDYAKTLEAHQLKHALITTARVDHLRSTTLKTLPPHEAVFLTSKQELYYARKWIDHSALKYYVRLTKSWIAYVMDSLFYKDNRSG